MRVVEITGSHSNATLREKYINVNSIVSIIENDTIKDVIANSPALIELDERTQFSTIQLNVGMHGATVNVVGSPHTLTKLLGA
tara:strand:+ start:15207 stop:15455 length:249 start_codon:yes stop_codon:yes gene_type:complete